MFGTLHSSLLSLESYLLIRFSRSRPGLLLLGFLFASMGCRLLGQSDSVRIRQLEALVRKIQDDLKWDSIRMEEYEKSTFYLYQYLDNPDTAEPRLKLGAYLDTYYAWYRDSTGSEFSKFPTVAPRHNQFGINMLYFSAQYSGEKSRANIGLHFGDIPGSSWDPKFNMIQEANLGIRILPRLWLDGGFFRTHIGVESIQPRENIAASLALTSCFEPYFFSGLKLSYSPASKLTLQLQVFNGYNNFVENNSNKALGTSATYAWNQKSAVVFNVLYSDESPDSLAYRRPRLYHNAYYVYRGSRVEVGAEANAVMQGNSGLMDSTLTAFAYSGTLMAKYKFKRLGVYGRGEFFQDRQEMLTGPLENENHQWRGIHVIGGTVGVEFKPVPHSYLRLESRCLQSLRQQQLFYWNQQHLTYRMEVIAAMGVWF